MVPKKASGEERTFEQAVGELEALVRKLEGNELTLDESLVAFEKGMGLARECETRLEEAKGKVEQLLKDASGRTKVAPFEAE